MAICISLYVVGNLSPGIDDRLLDRLGFFPLSTVGKTDNVARGLEAIQAGQVWRLITPIFLHLGIMHIVFNMWAFWQAGSIIEARCGIRRFALIVFLSAIASNVGQYLYMINFQSTIHPFAGMSGVVYALFGFIWMKGKVSPEDGMMLSPFTVRLMLLWLGAGFVISDTHMANGAHLMGLIVGMLFGLAGI